MNTPLDALIEALEGAGAYNAAAQAPPQAVLWCDEAREFSSLLSLLRARLPNLLTYGEIDAATRTGPAVWLRAATARALPDIDWPPGKPPILYLPGVSRETLRGFLAAGRGSLNLEVADDDATRLALPEAATVLFARPLDDLRGQRWNADSLHALLSPDLEADMLAWMCGALDGARLNAFAARAIKELAFDPRRLSPQDAARRLARREGDPGHRCGRGRRQAYPLRAHQARRADQL